MPSATIRIFLAHGDPKRLRTAELSNWIGKAVAGPRSEFDSVLARDESQNSGVYLLTGTDPETGRSAVYIGEAESIQDRVKGHLDKDFWNHISFFISKNENLTKAHIRYRPTNMRQQLKDQGSLKEGAGHLAFTINIEFSSPSAAASVIHDGHVNGLTAWKNKDGKTLKEIESV